MTEALAIGEEDAAFLITSILLPPASLKKEIILCDCVAMFVYLFGDIAGIYMDKTMADKSMYIPNDNKKINPFVD